MTRTHSFDTIIACEVCGNPDQEVRVTATYTSEWTVENVEATTRQLGNHIELSVAQGDRLVTQAAEHWEDAKKEYEDALADREFEIQKDVLLHSLP